jgi:hypothetical protein
MSEQVVNDFARTLLANLETQGKDQKGQPVPGPGQWPWWPMQAARRQKHWAENESRQGSSGRGTTPLLQKRRAESWG